MSGLPALQAPELWCVDLVAAAPALHALEQRIPRLCAGDWDRAAAFSDAGVRHEWLATHIALRLLIERAAGRRWRGATLARSERGKPHLDGALAFSLSHAPGVALIGVAPHGSIGVDVERRRKVRIGAARRAHIEAAGAALGCELPAGGEESFLQAWVRLEAYAKADGCGIGRLLTRLGILGTAAAAVPEGMDMRARAAALLAADRADIRDLQVGEGIYAAAAFRGISPTGEVAWLPASAEGLEKLVN